MTKSDNRTYVAVIGDAIASRTLTAARRTALQEALKRTLGTVNRRWARHTAARFAIALGDQFEGLLRSGTGLWDVVHFIRAELGQVDWVIACGKGPITTRLAATAVEVDGPCFHEARAALDAAKRTRLVLTCAGFVSAVDPLARYYSALYWSWTARQREAAALLRVAEPAAAAARLGVDRSAVSHFMRRMAWDLVSSGDDAFRKLLEAA